MESSDAMSDFGDDRRSSMDSEISLDSIRSRNDFNVINDIQLLGRKYILNSTIWNNPPLKRPVPVTISYRNCDPELHCPLLVIVDSNKQVRMMKVNSKELKGINRRRFSNTKRIKYTLEEVTYFSMGYEPHHSNAVASVRSEYIACGSHDGMVYIYNPHACVHEARDERDQVRMNNTHRFYIIYDDNSSIILTFSYIIF